MSAHEIDGSHTFKVEAQIEPRQSREQRGDTMTKPTRAQQHARTLLGQAILAISEAARLDGTTRFSTEALREVTERIARASSAYTYDEIVVTALEQRLKAMGLPSSHVELLTLIDQTLTPLEMLHLDDENLKQRIIDAEAELG